MTDDFHLEMTEGPQPGQTFPLDEDLISLGRDPANDLTISHPQVSRQHARLIRRGNVMVLEDIGSTNGTFVNGMRLTAPHALADGDVINLGESITLTFHGPSVSMEETVAARPEGVPTAPAPPPQADFPPPPPPPAHAPPLEPAPPSKRRTRRWVGCGCGTLLTLILLAATLFLMDLYFPHILYAPLGLFGLPVPTPVP